MSKNEEFDLLSEGIVLGLSIAIGTINNKEMKKHE